MIIDVHSHAWEYPRHFNDDFRQQAARAKGGTEFDLSVTLDAYRASGGDKADRTIVFGGKAKLSGLWVDDAYVANYVAQDPDRLIGFLSVDPTQDGWEEEMAFGHQELGMRGIKLLSMYAGFYPHDERLDPLWEYATQHQLPVLLHTGTTFVAQAPLDCTLPRHLDPVATRFPDVRIIMAHIGHPYEGECVVVVRKHPHVYTDLSALHYRPFQLYQSLMLVQEYGVWDKVLFGTDYPFTTVDASIEGLVGLNQMLDGTALPRLDEARIGAVIERDALELLRL
ncbi:MAG: amidohydrolase [Gemmatimonadetes bacterium]|nr:amidohydrolase [Gemmatimonadota bacterium]MBT6150209.1 amidohydrolase [Gemmatimonadota bacterium]MBT7863485.1 amidohydrolase [Gemmatimonadota bacterium]